LPEFVKQGREMQAMIDEAKPGNKWPKACPRNKIKPMEYGLILVDFPSRSVLSRNDYSRPNELMLAPVLSNFGEVVENARWLLDNGFLETVKAINLKDKEPKFVEMLMETFVSYLENPKLFPHSMIVCNLSNKLFNYDVTNCRRPGRDEIVSWCKERGWSIPISKKWPLSNETD
jgi:hypothetical protein